MAKEIVFVVGKDPLRETGGGHSSYVRAHARVAADNETLLHVGQFRNATQEMQHPVSGLCACCRPSCWFQVQATHAFMRVALEIIIRVSS